ncbi:DNA-3-methyladenine glycosylase 2 family protein [Limnohabitans radicicola]|uniref:DNA-3-methyladenine glycosylase II n=1 Tax=Limnohabitans radicicola TaxID=2771427 RepID=A0A927FD22_9BURK|nr:helix-turn-helix domain-containing protein [Limnohabitans radicicola]
MPHMHTPLELFLHGQPVDEGRCYRAFQDKDARFDGLFFMGVRSTGIYCRPVCRVRLPLPKNCRFFETPTQAEAAGFRPCLKCRPELAPAQRWWSTTDASAILAQAAARLLDQALTQGGKAPAMTALAAQLGVSDRHLRRVFETHWQVSPLQYLQTQRLLLAKQWLHDSPLPTSEIAHLSGFGSTRRMNACFAQHYRLAPRQLRPQTRDPEAPVTLRLAYRPPLQREHLWGFLQSRSLPGVELWTGEGLRAQLHRTVRWSPKASRSSPLMGWIVLGWAPDSPHVQLQASASLLPVLPELVAQVRQWLDLDADPAAVHAVLGHHFAQAHGIRIPGGLDHFELAVRAVLGQQITVKAARTLGDRLVQALGQPCQTPWPELNRHFPDAATLAREENAVLMGSLGIVRQRQCAIQALARAVDSGQLQLTPGSDVAATLSALQTLPGIGPWTAHYLAMRTLHWEDAWPVQDVALQNALGVRDEARPTQALERMGQVWQPFRSYALLAAWAWPAPSHTALEKP